MAWIVAGSRCSSLMFFAAMTGGGDPTALKLAWAYVIVRVLHSLVQATINRVIVRFSIFALGSIVLMIFTFREVMRTMG